MASFPVTTFTAGTVLMAVPPVSDGLHTPSRSQQERTRWEDRHLRSSTRYGTTSLASVHPVCSAGGVHPPFSLFVDGEATFLTGTLDTWSADQFRRILATTPGDRPLVVDLSQAEFVDHRAL